MNRLSWCLLAAALALPGCKQKKSESQPAAAETAPRLASTVEMGDARVAGQLTSGFYGIENSAWRWTGKQFALNLATPPGAGRNGAVFELKLTVPPVTIEKLQSVTLSGSVNGAPLAPETYTRPGQYSYRRELPPSAVSGNSVNAALQLDKAMPPAGGDLRELGIIVSAASLQPR